MKSKQEHQHIPKRQVLLFLFVLAISGALTGQAYAQPITVLVNGSFSNPPVAWMVPGPEFDAITATYGAPPVQSYWDPSWNVLPPYYIDIVAGRYPLANFLNSLPPAEVNLVTHSHGGNVAIMATYLTGRRLRHLINLGTPINWDLPGALGGRGADSRCQISSAADWVQFVGASPYQVGHFVYDIYQSIAGGVEAFQALLAGDYATAYAYFADAIFDVIDATYWWFTTKIEEGEEDQSGNPVLRCGAGGQGMRWKPPASPH